MGNTLEKYGYGRGHGHGHGGCPGCRHRGDGRGYLGYGPGGWGWYGWPVYPPYQEPVYLKDDTKDEKKDEKKDVQPQIIVLQQPPVDKSYENKDTSNLWILGITTLLVIIIIATLLLK